MLDFFHSETFTMTLRLCLAGILSGLIGLEREVKKHPAGFRTHLLVGVGACTVMLLSIYGFRDMLALNPNIRFDPSRLASYVISGIGFLGAGTILVQGGTVRGLTTAASIWVVSAIGLVVGDGMYFISIFTTIIVIISLIFLNKWEQSFIRKRKLQSISIFLQYQEMPLTELFELIEKEGIVIHKTELEKDNEFNEVLKMNLTVAFSKQKQFIELLERLANLTSVKKIKTTE